MATATLPPAPPRPAEQRLVLENIRWDQYLALSDWVVGERPIHVTYDRGWLEIMPLSFAHERSKKILGQMVEILLDILEIPSECAGSTTFRRQDLERGLEPDDCYYLENFERIRGKKELDLNIDPPPDLVIEVDVTSSSLVRINIYGALGVPEVWRLVDEHRVEFLRLDAAARYVAHAESLHFPGLTAEDVSRFVQQALTMDKTAWRKTFRAWVRETLVPPR